MDDGIGRSSKRRSASWGEMAILQAADELIKIWLWHQCRWDGYFVQWISDGFVSGYAVSNYISAVRILQLGRNPILFQREVSDSLPAAPPPAYMCFSQIQIMVDLHQLIKYSSNRERGIVF